MEKKFYIQPNTDFALLANGRPIMERLTLSGSGSAGQMAPSRLVGGDAPSRNINVLYI